MAARIMLRPVETFSWCLHFGVPKLNAKVEIHTVIRTFSNNLRIIESNIRKFQSTIIQILKLYNSRKNITQQFELIPTDFRYLNFKPITNQN